MEALYKSYGPRGFEIVAVSIDDPGDAAKVREFVTEFGLTFDVLHDGAGAIQKVYQTTGVPENFLIGADGVRSYLTSDTATIAPLNGVAEAELTAVVLAPALDGAVGESHTRACLQQGQLDRRAGGAEGDRGQGDAHGVWLAAMRGQGALAELPSEWSGRSRPGGDGPHRSGRGARHGSS